MDGVARATEQFRFPETLSLTAARLLAEAFRAHYLGVRVPPSAPGAVESSTDPTTGRTEFRWVQDPTPPIPWGPTLGTGPVTVHVTIAPDRLTIEFGSARPLDTSARQALARLADEVQAFSTRYLRVERLSSVYLALPWGTGAAVGETVGSHEVVRRIVSGNSTNVFLLIIVISLPAVFFLGIYAFVLMIGLQGAVLVFIDRIAAASGPVRPSPERPQVLVVGVAETPEGGRALRKSVKRTLPALRRELGHLTAGSTAPPSGADVTAVFARLGIPCTEADVRITLRDVYAPVARVAARFGLPVPRLVVSDQPLSNAAATGVSPGHATVVVTAGAIEQLDDGELAAVIGHEFGHLRGRDPIVLFGTNAVLYLGAVFLWLPLFLELGLFYLLLAFALLFAVGKVLETRADTLSALVLGEGADLARALEASEFDEEYVEGRSYGARVLGWLSLDSHPPIYFRVRRLFRISRDVRTARHPLWASVRDCASGFLHAVAGGA